MFSAYTGQREPQLLQMHGEDNLKLLDWTLSLLNYGEELCYTRENLSAFKREYDQSKHRITIPELRTFVKRLRAHNKKSNEYSTRKTLKERLSEEGAWDPIGGYVSREAWERHGRYCAWSTYALYRVITDAIPRAYEYVTLASEELRRHAKGLNADTFASFNAYLTALKRHLDGQVNAIIESILMRFGCLSKSLDFKDGDVLYALQAELIRHGLELWRPIDKSKEMVIEPVEFKTFHEFIQQYGDDEQKDRLSNIVWMKADDGLAPYTDPKDGRFMFVPKRTLPLISQKQSWFARQLDRFLPKRKTSLTCFKDNAHLISDYRQLVQLSTRHEGRPYLNEGILSRYEKLYHLIEAKGQAPSHWQPNGFMRFFYRRHMRITGSWHAALPEIKIKLIEKQLAIYRDHLAHAGSLINNEGGKYLLSHKVLLKKLEKQIRSAILTLDHPQKDALQAELEAVLAEQHHIREDYYKALEGAEYAMHLLSEVARGEIKSDGHLKPLFDYYASLEKEDKSAAEELLESAECKSACAQAFSFYSYNFFKVIDSKDSHLIKKWGTAGHFISRLSAPDMKRLLQGFADNTTSECLILLIDTVKNYPEQKLERVAKLAGLLNGLKQHFADKELAGRLKRILEVCKRYQRHALNDRDFIASINKEYKSILARNLRLLFKADLIGFRYELFQVLADKGYAGEGSQAVIRKIVGRMLDEGLTDVRLLGLEQNSIEFMTLDMGNPKSELVAGVNFWIRLARTLKEAQSMDLGRIRVEYEKCAGQYQNLPEKLSRQGLFKLPAVVANYNEKAMLAISDSDKENRSCVRRGLTL